MWHEVAGQDSTGVRGLRRGFSSLRRSWGMGKEGRRVRVGEEEGEGSDWYVKWINKRERREKGR